MFGKLGGLCLSKPAISLVTTLSNMSLTTQKRMTLSFRRVISISMAQLFPDDAQVCSVTSTIVKHRVEYLPSEILCGLALKF